MQVGVCMKLPGDKVLHLPCGGCIDVGKAVDTRMRRASAGFLPYDEGELEDELVFVAELQ